MAIQFLCPACSQPIEIDPDWAGRSVDCPYCRKRVTAPLESTYSPEPAAPVARPMGSGPVFQPVAEVPATLHAAQTIGRNAVAVWALVLSLSSLACFITGSVIMGMHIEDIEPLIRMSEEGKSYSEINQAFLEQFEHAPPPWLLGFALVMFLSFTMWLAAVVCGIIGLRREPRRKFAIAGLAVSALVLLLVAVPNA